jgi:hypothetical protein
MYRLFSTNSSPSTLSISATDQSLPYTLIGTNQSHKMATPQPFEFQLSSLAQLDVIDKLRELGVGDFVALPQLVVVGDQSRRVKWCARR